MARSRSTPPISKIIRPANTTATQPSTLPLPEPIRVSAGFLVKGLSGYTRSQTLPPRLILRVMATRAASSWRLVIQADSRAWMPNSPKDRVVPRGATPFILPRIILRYLTLLGLSILGYRPFVLVCRGNLFPLDDFALENPHLDADGAVGGFRARLGVVDIGAQRLQGNTTVAGLLHAGDLGAAET